MKTDSELQTDVAHELAWDIHIDETAIRVSVHHGAVALNGVVDSWAAKHAPKSRPCRPCHLLAIIPLIAFRAFRAFRAPWGPGALRPGRPCLPRPVGSRCPVRRRHR